MPSTIVIGPAEHLPALEARGVEGQTRAFEDTDALRALDAIIEERPEVVLIERGFAHSSRGAALIKRLKTDATLAACDIRVVGPDGRDAERGATPAAAAALPSTEPTTAPTLDQRGTRRAPRVVMPEGIDVQIDGDPATLVDLSLLGAQVVSPTSLKPRQRVRLVLPDPTQPARCRATVAWVEFEIPKGVARYRAGIHFVDADQALLARFIQTNTAKK